MSTTATDLRLTYVPGAGPAFKPLSRHDVAAILGVSVRTVENWRRDKLIPPSVDIGGRVYWHPELFYAGLDATLRATGMTSDEGGAPMVNQSMRSSNRAPAATGALEKARRRSAETIAAMTGQ